MGGRGGGSSGGVKAIEINNGKTIMSYREHKGKIVDMNKTAVKNTNGKSLNDLVEKAKELGWSVKTYNSKQLKQRDDKYKQDRKKADKQLNDIYAKSRGTAKKHRGK